MNLADIGLVVAAAIPAHLIGALWYGYLFAGAWYTRVYKIPNRTATNVNSVLPYIISFGSNILISYLLYKWFGLSHNINIAETIGILAVIFLALAGPQFAFSQWSPIVYLIDCGHSIACVAVMAYIHSAFVVQR